MRVKVGDLVRAMEALAPPGLAAPWDNVGLLVGDAQRSLSRVLLAVDATREVVAEAARAGCEAIVAYHPPIFEPQRAFVAGTVAYAAASAGVAIYSPHTALDVADGGTNDVLADAVGLIERAPLRRLPATPSGPPGSAASDEVRGFGRVGSIGRATVVEIVERTKRALGASHVLVAGPMDREVVRVAVCAGSGGDFIPDAAREGAGVLLTGELRHHDALRAVALGLTVLCTGHSVSERAVLPHLARRLAERLPGVNVSQSAEDREPFVVV